MESYVDELNKSSEDILWRAEGGFQNKRADLIFVRNGRCRCLSTVCAMFESNLVLFSDDETLNDETGMAETELGIRRISFDENAGFRGTGA